MILGTFVIVFTSQTVSTETQDVLHHHLYGAMEIDFFEEGKCTIDSVWGSQTFIYNGTCTQRFAIPTSEADYGLLPSCSAKPDGNYQFRTRPCDAYYRCEGGRATAVKCPEHTLFDVTRRTCASNVACYRA